jgi:hypothetical protein
MLTTERSTKPALLVYRLIDAIQQESIELISHAKYRTKMIKEQLESDFIENVKIHMQKCEREEIVCEVIDQVLEGEALSEHTSV